MPKEIHLTVGQLAERFQQPDWRIRRVVDGLDADVPRAGQYRLVPHSMLPDLEAELQRLGLVAEHVDLPSS